MSCWGTARRPCSGCPDCTPDVADRPSIQVACVECKKRWTRNATGVCDKCAAMPDPLGHLARNFSNPGGWP